MSDYIDKINSLEKQVNDNKLELAKLEERKNNLKKEKEKLLAELKELNINEEDLETVIIDAKEELDKLMEEAENELK